MTGSVRIHRREAVPMEDIVRRYIRSMGLSAPVNTRIIFEAWDKASGAGEFTLKKFFRAGTLYITLSSSMVRSQLLPLGDLLVEKINALVRDESLFDDKVSGFEGPVKKLVLK